MSLNEHAEIPELGEATDGARSLSLLRQAQKRSQERQKNLFLDVPSWNGDLVCEYEVIEKHELTAMSERNLARIRSGGFDKVQGDIELITKSAVGLWVRDPESGDRVQIEDEFGHVSYERILSVLGVSKEVCRPKDAVRYLMAERDDETGTWKENAVAIGMHAQALSRWMKDPSKNNKELDELLGES